MVCDALFLLVLPLLWYCVSDCLQKTNENYRQPSPPKTITRKFLLQQLLCNWFHPVTPRNPAKVVSHPKWWTTFGVTWETSKKRAQSTVHVVTSLFYHVVLSLHPFTYVGEIQPKHLILSLLLPDNEVIVQSCITCKNCKTESTVWKCKVIGCSFEVIQFSRWKSQTNFDHGSGHCGPETI